MRQTEDKIIKSHGSVFEYYIERQFKPQIHFDEIQSTTPGLRTPSLLSAGRCTWKERNGTRLLSMFSLTSRHIGWRGIIHGGITAGMIDDIFAQYCHVETPELFPLTRMLQIQFLKPAFPDEVLFARIAQSSHQPNSDRRRMPWASLDAFQISLGRLIRVWPSPGKDSPRKRGQKIWVQGHIEAVRNGEVITVARAEALFILCKQLPETPELVHSPHRACSVHKMSQELWDMVLEYLPSLTGRHVAQVFNFELTARHQSHSDIWSKIFKDKEAWTSIATRQGLNPVLIGDDLHSLSRNPMHPAYIVLSTGDKTGNIRHDRTKLLKSLRAHHWNEDNEIVFEESNITLNIIEALHNPFMITLPPKKLFSYQHNQLRSASLYWKDSHYAVRSIGPDDIVGIGDQASTLQDVSLICAITLTRPEEMALKQRHQQCFQHPKCPPAYPICPAGYEYNGDNILGWEWEDES